MLVVIILTGFSLYCVINARTVRVVYGTAALKNLDYRLDGVKILYISDLKISNDSDAEDALRLISRLNELKPDILLLGGDISGDSLINDLRVRLGIKTSDEVASERLGARDKFLLGMNELQVPYGIYAVNGDCDKPLSSEERARTNIRFLYDETANVAINGAVLPIYGELSGASFRLENGSRGAMIVMFHNPASYGAAALRASERSSDADSYLFLSAHLLGGQMRIGDTFFRYGDLNDSYTLRADEHGLYSQGSKTIKMLLSSGIGCEGLPFRLGSKPAAYMITLKRA